MAPIAAALPLVGGILGKLTADPKATVKTLLQFSFGTFGAVWFVFGLNGRRIAAMEGDRTFDAGAFEFAGAATVSSGSGGSGGGSGSTSPSGKGKGYDGIKAGLARSGLPADWADSSALWSLLMKESSSTKAGLKYPTNPSSGALGPFQLNPSSGTLQQYAGSAPYSDQELVDGGLKYIRDRYGDPNGAWAFWQSHGWY